MRNSQQSSGKDSSEPSGQSDSWNSSEQDPIKPNNYNFEQIFEDQALSKEEEELFNQLKKREQSDYPYNQTSSERKREEEDTPEPEDDNGETHKFELNLNSQSRNNRDNIFKLNKNAQKQNNERYY